MKLEELKVGQVVQLNSGGPRMTISSITDENNIECVYISIVGIANVIMKNLMLVF